MEEVFGFIAESQDQIVIAFRGYAAYPKDLLASYDIFQVPIPMLKMAGKRLVDSHVFINQQETI